MARALLSSWSILVRGISAAVILIAFVSIDGSEGATVPVRFVEGTTRGFLDLRSPDGKIIAHGDLLQVPRDGQVESRLVFHWAPLYVGGPVWRIEVVTPHGPGAPGPRS